MALHPPCGPSTFLVWPCVEACSSPCRLPAEALRPVALQLEARGWLLTPAQRCPLVRAAFLQVLALLPASLSPGFAQSIREAISTELGSFTLGKEPGCAELQVLLPAGDITAVPFCEAGAWGVGTCPAHSMPTNAPHLRLSAGSGSWFPSRWAQLSSTKPWPVSHAARLHGWPTARGLVLFARFSSSQIPTSSLPSSAG